MKVHDLIGSSYITNYAMLWLLIFYLQRLDIPIIPPIEEFQKHIPPYFISTANVAFDYSLPNLPRNRQQVAQLLLGFFEFYAGFDFESQIICPLYGRAFPQKDFMELFPKEFARYREMLVMMPSESPLRMDKVNFQISFFLNYVIFKFPNLSFFSKPICIQDPFELCKTVPGKVTPEYYVILRNAFGRATQICRQKLNDCGESNELLLALFDNTETLIQQPARTKREAKREIRTIARQQMMENEARALNPDDKDNRQKLIKRNWLVEAQKAELDIVRNILREMHPGKKMEETEVNNFWCELILNSYGDFLKDKFGVEIPVEEPASAAKQYSKTFEILGGNDLHAIVNICTVPDREKVLSFSIEDLLKISAAEGNGLILFFNVLRRTAKLRIAYLKK